MLTPPKEVPLALKELTLYQWPASEHCDSIYVRCTKIQRVMGLLQLPYQVADIGLPNTNDEEEISSRVMPLMRKIPILKVGDSKLIEQTTVIVDFLVKTTGFKGFAFAKESVAASAFFLESWVQHWLSWLVIKARWEKESNYRNFFVTLGDLNLRSRIKKSLNYTRQRACENLRMTEVGRLSEDDYLADLKASLARIEAMLEGSDFLFGEQLKEVDISVFMCMQAFFDPSLTAENELAMACPNIRRWMASVDRLTSTPHTRTPIVEPTVGRAAKRSAS